VHGPDELRRAVAHEDLAALTRVPGIGRKGAQRIVLELKDRIGAPGPGPTGGPAATSGAAGGAGSWRDQVHQALLGLGWSARDADSAVSAVADQAGDAPDVSVLLRAALRTLAKS
jgi:Holliday junction DNA helicase RuvA